MVTQNDRRAKSANLTDLVGEAFVQPSLQSEAVEKIDDSIYEQVSIPAAIFTKELCSFIDDKELFKIIEGITDKDEKKKAKLALIIGEAYIAKSDDRKFKAKLKDHILSGNYDDVLEYVAVETNRKIDSKMLNKLLDERIKEMLSKTTEKKDMMGYTFEALKGKLGTGQRLTKGEQSYEHWDNFSGESKYSTLRIKFDGKKYKAILHKDNFNGMINYNWYSKLLGVTNSVFDSTLEIGQKGFIDQLVANNDSRKNGQNNEANVSEKTLNIRCSTENNCDDTLRFFRIDNQKYVSLNINISMSSAMASLLGFVISAATSSGPLAIASGSLMLSSFIYVASTETGGGLVLALAKASNDYKGKYLSTSSSMDYIKQKLEEVSNYNLDAGSARKAAKKQKEAEKRFSEMEQSWDYLGQTKGFSIEFESESLDDIYMKSHLLIEGIKKIK